MSVKKMSMIAMMTCLIAVSSWLTIPAGVPFSMQTFAVFCSLLLLGGKSGLTAIVLYVFIGCTGIPVFSGFQGGIGHIIGPTGGYIIGFIFIGVLYIVFEPLFSKGIKLQLPVLAGGLIICYFVGSMWFLTVFEMRGTSYSFGDVLLICVLPYVIPDLGKLAMAWVVSNRIRKAIPNL